MGDRFKPESVIGMGQNMHRAYYQQQEARGKPHNTIIRALAFKWIRIIFRCWKDHKPYDESKYLEALRRRGSPLLQFAVNP